MEEVESDVLLLADAETLGVTAPASEELTLDVLLAGTSVVLMATVVDRTRVLLAGQEVTSGGQLVIVQAVVA